MNSNKLSSNYYIGNKVFKTLTVMVLGQEQKLKVSDAGQGIIGVVYVYEDEKSAKDDNGDGYTKAVEVEELPNELN
jgi:hypothetical protein